MNWIEWCMMKFMNRIFNPMYFMFTTIKMESRKRAPHLNGWHSTHNTESITKICQIFWLLFTFFLYYFSRWFFVHYYYYRIDRIETLGHWASQVSQTSNKIKQNGYEISNERPFKSLEIKVNRIFDFWWMKQLHNVTSCSFFCVASLFCYWKWVCAGWSSPFLHSSGRRMEYRICISIIHQELKNG